MKDPAQTFRWIIDILNRHNVPFVVTGGLAAKSYGSPRPLNDIDIEIHQKDFDKILDDVRPYIVEGPGPSKDEWWDEFVLVLNHNGQDIDITAGDVIKIHDVRTGEWKAIPTDFTDVEQRKIFGLTVPVSSRPVMIAYKSMLAGEQHQIDLRAIAASK